MLSKLLQTTLICLISMGVYAQSVLHVVELYYADPVQVAAAIRPILAADDAIRSYDNKLIINTDRSRIDKISEIISLLDAKPRQILISLTEDTQLVSRELNAGYPTANGQYSAQINQQQTSANQVKTIKVMEGKETYIGQSGTAQVRRNTGYGSEYGRVQPIVVENGLHITVRLMDDIANITIRSKSDQWDDDSGTVQGNSIDTRIMGKIGEWIAVGGMSQTNNSSRQQNLSTSINREQSGFQLFVKIQPLN